MVFRYLSALWGQGVKCKKKLYFYDFSHVLTTIIARLDKINIINIIFKFPIFRIPIPLISLRQQEKFASLISTIYSGQSVKLNAFMRTRNPFRYYPFDIKPFLNRLILLKLLKINFDFWGNPKSMIRIRT